MKVLNSSGEEKYDMTPDNASDTAAGIIELAVQSEMETATDVARAVTPGRTQYHPGVAKAWALWTVAGGAVTTVGTHNVSSLTDAGTGLVTVNFTTAFSAATYAVGSAAGVNSSGAGTEYCTCSFRNGVAPTTTALAIQTVRIGTQDSQDTAIGSIAAYGDQ